MWKRRLLGLVLLRNFLEELRVITNKTNFCTRPYSDSPSSDGISRGGGGGCCLQQGWYVKSKLQKADSFIVVQSIVVPLSSYYYYSSSFISTTAHYGLWPVEQCSSIFSYLPPTHSIFSLPALEDLFLLPLSIFSWAFPFFSSLPVREWRSFCVSYPPPFSLGDLTNLSFELVSILLYFIVPPEHTNLHPAHCLDTPERVLSFFNQALPKFKVRPVSPGFRVEADWLKCAALQN